MTTEGESGVAGRAVGIVRAIDAGATHIEVRDATPRDLPALRILQRRCFPEDQAYGFGTLLVLFLWRRVRILVAWNGDQVAGCVVGDVNRTRDQARILNLCVDPDSRRLGIGTALLSAAEEVLGTSDVMLMVEDKNLGAQELYRRQGYLPVSDLRDYYGKNRHGILMQKKR